MIEYQRDQQQKIPDSHVKVVGIGGAGLNMLDRVALDGMQGVELLALAADARTLGSSVAQERVQLGAKLTMGLGCGGDPELGNRAAQEQELEIRDALRDRRIVFICVGLGGGTGSGAAPLVARLAREVGAFVVIFATMPFSFEGRRRREQAETALNELSVVANALVTFENSRMGELVLAAQGIHEAFAAADRMISESIQAVTRLVVRPGLVNVGLDELMTSLNSTRSRCLFGSGLAVGENRSQAALQNALSSPLLDKGKLLKGAQTALVHICGGESMTLYEVELLMRDLAKHVPENAQLLFGAAVDPSMGDGLSVTLISSLPESELMQQEVAQEETSRLVEEETQQHVELEVSETREEFSEEEPVSVQEENSEEQNYEQQESLEIDTEVSDEELEEAITEEEAAESTSEVTEAEVQESIFEELVETVSESVSAEPSTQYDTKSQAELELNGGPRGKFEGEAPNLLDGEDLDIPPYLRNKLQ